MTGTPRFTKNAYHHHLPWRHCLLPALPPGAAPADEKNTRRQRRRKLRCALALLRLTCVPLRMLRKNTLYLLPAATFDALCFYLHGLLIPEPFTTAITALPHWHGGRGYLAACITCLPHGNTFRLVNLAAAKNGTDSLPYMPYYLYCTYRMQRLPGVCYNEKLNIPSSCLPACHY